MTLTALTYNLRDGGGDRGERLDAIAEVIGAATPDVVAVQELGRSPAHARVALRRLADALGMRAYAARSWLPGGQPVGLLIRPAARVVAAAALPGPFHHGAVQVVVDTDIGELAVLSTHLCPYSGLRRRWEAGWLARATRLTPTDAGPTADGGPAADGGRAGRPGAVLLLGDLNSLDPRTDHAATLAGLPGAYRRRHSRRDGSADTRAVAALERAGLTDLFARAGEGPGGTVPTGYAGAEFGGVGGVDGSAESVGAHGGPVDSGMRLDYALGSAPVARLAQTCLVVTTGGARTASDHYPLLTRLAVEPVLDRR